MLTIKDLHAEADGKKILKGVNFTMHQGETHVIMGENGSGKSTLSLVLAGHPRYKITQGEILFNGERLNELSADQRAKLGLFLSMQHPPEIEGVRFSRFLQEARKSLIPSVNSNVFEMQEDLKSHLHAFGFQQDVLQRSVNLGFSGGEKKKSELVQLSFLEPNLAILDEFDSGLDIDALRNVSGYLSGLKKEHPEKSLLLITHYSKIFDFIYPDYVHVMIDGKIAASGGREIAEKIEREGYSGFKL
jgi:Fe-S cluster assembly ATP-binding protein